MIDREYTRDEFFTLIRKRLNDALDGNHDDEKKERYEKEKDYILNRGLTREFAILYRITEFAKAENQVIYIDGWLHYFYCLFLLGVTDFGTFDFVENGYDLPFEIINPLPYTNFINIRCTAILLRAISNLYQCEVNYFHRDNPFGAVCQGNTIYLVISNKLPPIILRIMCNLWQTFLVISRFL